MKKGDIVLIIALLLVSAVLFIALSRGEEGATAVVAVNGQEVARYSLTEDGVFPLNGGTNILVIEDGEAYLEDANCPDRLCVKMGRISKTGQCITCLPNKLTVTVEGAGEKEIDLMAG